MPDKPQGPPTEAEVLKLARGAVRQQAGQDRGRGPSLVERWQSALLTDEELCNRPAPEPLVGPLHGSPQGDHPLLLRHTTAMLYGESGAGKSFVALDLAQCIARGMPWQGREVERGPVLYIAAEGDSGLGSRVRAWREHNRVPPGASGMVTLPLAPNLLDQEEAEALAELVRELRPVLVVVDTLARATVGGDENSARDMGMAVAAADAVRRAGDATVLLVHHAGKDGSTYRGSSALKAAMDTLLRVEASDERLNLAVEKQKDAADGWTVPLRLRQVTLTSGGTSCVVTGLNRHDLEDSNGPRQREILAVMRDMFSATGASNSQLAEALKVGQPGGIPKASFYKAKNAVVEAGQLVKRGQLFYLPVPAEEVIQ